MQSLFEGFRQFVLRLPVAQRITIGAVFLGGIMLLGGVGYWASQPDYALLFGGLAPTGASRIVDALRDEGVKYKLKEGGTAVYVPRDDVYELRLRFATENVAADAASGYELFDTGALGMTDFMQKLNLKRALEGELSRTISSLRQVEVARVHLVMPERSPFRDAQTSASSSVVLRFNGSDRLSSGQIEGMTSLVAGAVEGLTSDRVTVLDTGGNILSTPQSGNGNLAMSGSQLRVTRELEDHLTNKGQTMLDQFLGPGNAIVRVVGHLDFSQSVSERHSVDPESATVISEERVEQEDDAATGSSMLRNYDLTRTQERSESGAYTVKNMSISLVVNQKQMLIEEDQASPPEAVPYTQAELDEFEQVVKTAVGFDESRGDIFAVHQRLFDTSSQDQMAGDIASAEKTRQVQVIGRYVAMLIGMLVGVWLLRSGLSKVASMSFPEPPIALNPARAGGGAEHSQLATGENGRQSAGGQSDDVFHPSSDVFQSKLSTEAQARLQAKNVLYEEIVADMGENPAEAADLLRSWISEDDHKMAHVA